MRANCRRAVQLALFPKNNISFAVTSSEQLEWFAPLA
jgi:hypothetical protein